MKRFLFPAVFLFAIVSIASAATPAPAATPTIGLHAAATLTNAQASQHPLVAFQATVTYYRAYDKDLFVQDGDDAIYVHPKISFNLAPGDRVVIRGTMHESFRPYVDSADIAVIGHVPLPSK